VTDRAPHRPTLRSVLRRALAAGIAVTAACAGAQQPAGAGPAAAAPTTDAPLTASVLVPPGYGTLRQDDIAIRLQLAGVQVKAIPLDEGVIRLLSPDSYRALRDLQESRRADLSAVARRYGLQQYRVWYVSYFGLAPEARFSPNEVTITNNGRDFRPLDMLPITAGFGENRLQLRQTQAALYLFDGALDAGQPVVLRVETATDAPTWPQALQRMERERGLVRSRAATAAGQRP
jgi:hypothetical protein